MCKFVFSEKPILTCMIQAKTPERVFELIDKGIHGGTQAFALQLERLERQYHTPAYFRAFFERMDGRPAYVTNYRYCENEGKTDWELAEELLLAAQCGGQLVDIMGDMFCPSPDQITYDESAVKAQKEWIARFHALGKQVLMSSHTLRFMEYETVHKIARAQKSRGADVAKVVTAAGNQEELAENHTITAKLAQELKLPFLFLCGGEACRPHRRIGPIVAGGLFFCVAEHDELSTPTQPLLSDARKIIELIF